MAILMTAPAAAPSAPSTADEKALREIADGNMDTFRQLYEAHARSVYGFALSITKNTHDAEEVLQETFLAILQKAGSYRPQSKPLAWILTIARNAALTRLRQRRRETGPPPEEAEAFSRIESAGERLLIKAALEHLDDEERQILMLRAVAGFKSREVAAVLGMPLGSVLSKYHRAAKKLRIRMESEEIAE